METLVNKPIVQRDEAATPDDLTGRAEDLTFLQLKDFFGVEGTDSRETILDIARLVDGGKGLDIVDIMWEIKNLEGRIGAPPLGMSRLQHLYNFVKIDSQISKLRKQQEAYMR